MGDERTLRSSRPLDANTRCNRDDSYNYPPPKHIH